MGLGNMIGGHLPLLSRPAQPAQPQPQPQQSLYHQPPALNGGAVMTPEQVARNRAIAEQLLKSGSDVRGVDSGIEAIGKVFESGVGMMMQRRADKQQQAGNQLRSDVLSGRNRSFGGLF